MTKVHRVPVYSGRSNQRHFDVFKNSEAFDLNDAGVTRIEIIAGRSALDSTTNAISYSGNRITLKAGALDMLPGEYPTQIIAYTATDSAGQVIFGPGLDETLLLSVQS